MLARRLRRLPPYGGDAPSAGFALRSPRAPLDNVAQAGVSALFQAVMPLLAHTTVRRDLGAHLAPQTIVAFAHKRDLDVPALIAALLGPHVWPRWLGRVTFIGSADLYLDGFLGLYFPQLGRPLRRLLYRTNLGPVLRALRIVPAGSTGTQMVAEWIDGLRSVFPATTPLSAVLSERGLGLARAAGIEPRLTLAEARRWRNERLLTIQSERDLLTAEALRRLQIAQAWAAQSMLDAAVTPLRAGGVVVIAPEGQRSPDGAQQPLRSGLHLLLREAPQARVLPVATTYDLLPDGRRPRLFLNIGAPLFDLGTLPRRQADRILGHEFGRLGTVTLAQLVARAVLDDPEQRSAISTTELALRLAAEAHRLSAAGQPLDPLLLDRATFLRRFRALLRAAQGRGLDVQAGEVRIDHAMLRRPVNGWQANPIGYAYNESRGVPAWQAN